MISLSFCCRQEEKDVLIGELWECHTAGLVEHESAGELWQIEAFFSDSAPGEQLLERFAHWRPRLRRHVEENHITCFQSAWPPMAVGERFWLAPPWDPSPAPPGRLRLDYQTGMACGSGAHPCTRLCLMALERHLKPGDRFLDVGSGSGILLAAAELLGARLACGCDIDEECVRAAREKLPGAVVFRGSAEAARPGYFTVAAANISAEAAAALEAVLLELVAPRGRVILSGFTRAEMPQWREPAEVVELEGWACAILTRTEFRRP